MKIFRMAMAAAALVALGACTSADRFGPGGGAATGGFGADGGIAGSASDPTSPAFFNETIGDRVLFAVDQSTLTTEAQAVLDQQAVWLTQNGEYRALIEGHADEQGTREYNLALGARRASAVQNYLISRGVAPGRLQTISYGKERPLAICSDESCYSQNRRSVTVITAGAGI